MTKYIMIDSGSSASRMMFRDVKGMEDAVETSLVFQIDNPVLRLMNWVHMSGKINRAINLPGKSIWDKYCIIENAKKDSSNHYIVIFTNISIRKIRLGYLQELEKYPNISLVLIAVDSFVDKQLCPLDIMQKVKFDLVYSFDAKDCAEYGLEFTQSMYSKRDDIIPDSVLRDIFFIGRSKGRYNTLATIAQKAHLYGANCDFQILADGTDAVKECEGISYIDHVKSYDEVLPMILSSKCLLDIVQEGQEGLTMRVYESIFYNKYLITNNENVKKMKYYKPEYMFVCNDVSQVDLGFLTEKKEVDYGYCNDYSPVHLLHKMNETLIQRGKIS